MMPSSGWPGRCKLYKLTGTAIRLRVSRSTRSCCKPLRLNSACKNRSGQDLHVPRLPVSPPPPPPNPLPAILPAPSTPLLHALLPPVPSSSVFQSPPFLASHPPPTSHHPLPLLTSSCSYDDVGQREGLGTTIHLYHAKHCITLL